MDGWGVRPAGPGNAISLAETPVFDRLVAEYPHGVLEASGGRGLPPGQMGNSEVGHLNIGAGRVVYQDLTRINRRHRGRQLLRATACCARPAPRPRAGAAALHLMGLVSDGGVHSRPGPPRGAAASWPARAGVERRRRPRLPRRPRHAAARAPRATSPSVAGVHGPASASGRYGVDQRPLLRHGPRQALGPGRAGLRRAGARRGLHRGRLRRRRSTPPTRAARTTSSCARRSSRPSTDVARRATATCHLLQLPPRPGPRAHARFIERGFAGFDRGAAPAGRRLRHHDRSTRRSSRCRSPSRRSSPRTCSPTCSPSTACTQLHIAETEKYAHVTFFFNGGARRRRGGGARAGAQPARRAHLRPQAAR